MNTDTDTSTPTPADVKHESHDPPPHVKVAGTQHAPPACEPDAEEPERWDGLA